MIGDHLHSLGNYLNESCKRYENFIIIGDFNSETKEDAMQDFCSVYSLKNAVNKPTCFKNIDHPLLFNIYINDLFLFSESFEIANYAHDCSPYEFSGSIDDVIYKLETDSRILIEWYENNYLKSNPDKPNPDKWHLILSNTDEELTINIRNEYISNSTCEKMLGVYFDNKLSFTSHITKLCKKAGQKLHSLARISTFMSLQQRKTIMNTFIQFGYCPLIWMCHSRSLNSKINRIHERALKIIYNDNISSFDQLLEISGSVTIHVRNLQRLTTEIYKALNTLSSTLVSELFQIKDMKYNLCKGTPLVTYSVKTVSYGTESISYLAPKIWEQVADEIKNCKSVNSFKSKIKLWTPESCRVFAKNIL